MIWTSKARFNHALLALESGVERTYQAYVKPIKGARSDGRLNEQEKDRARALAKARAISLCKEAGFDFIKAVGEDYVDVWIARIIQQRRG